MPSSHCRPSAPSQTVRTLAREGVNVDRSKSVGPRQKNEGYMSSPSLVGDHIYMHMKNERAVCLGFGRRMRSRGPVPVGSTEHAHNATEFLPWPMTETLRLVTRTPDSFNGRRMKMKSRPRTVGAHRVARRLVIGSGPSIN